MIPPISLCNDSNEYRAFTLANQIKVLLVQQHTVEVAAVSLNVGVGFNSDPPEVLGLAHLVEHVICKGCVKYPEEESFQRFISEKCGRSNAHTEQERTTYHFSIRAESSTPQGAEIFQEALDRFASCFEAPLFTKL